MSVLGDWLEVPSNCAGVAVLDRTEVLGWGGVALCCSDSEVSDPEVSGPSSGVGSASTGESVFSSSCSIGEFGSAVGSLDAGCDSVSRSDEASVRTLVGTASDVASVWTLVFTASDEASVWAIEGTASDVASVGTLVFTASDGASVLARVGTDSDLADSADDPTPRSPWAGFSVRLKGLVHL